MELWLIRHPRPLVAADTCYGRLDVAPAPEALEAAVTRLAPRLPSRCRLRSSPARRCLDLARRLGGEPLVDARLAERDFGAWEGQRWDDIGRAPIDAWAADPLGFAPPRGESARTVVQRVAGLLAEEAALGGCAVWVTHQGVARAVARHLPGLADHQWMSLRLEYGAMLRFVQEEGGWRRIWEEG